MSEHLATGILQMIQNHRTRFFDHSGEGMRIFLSVEDARVLDEMSKQRGDFFPISQIKDGDTGTLWGLPYSADAKLRPGAAFLGYRVAG